MTTPTTYAIATKRGEVEIGFDLDGQAVKLRLDLEAADDLVEKLQDAMEVAGARVAARLRSGVAA